MFGNVIGNLTQGELVMVVARFLEDVGGRMDRGEFSDADGVSLSEILEMFSKFAADAFKEYQDLPEEHEQEG